MKASYRPESTVAPLPDGASTGSGPVPAKIHIVGPNRSLNQSLLFFLETAIDAECTMANCLPQGALGGRSSDRMCVCLLDCMDWNRDAIQTQVNGFGDTLGEAIKIVCFNVDADCNMDAMAQWKGVWGIFHQGESRSTFLKGMRAILSGRQWFTPPPAASRGLDAGPQNESPEKLLQSLSTREKEILQLVAVGMSNSDVSTELVISLHTVKTHLYNIYQKIHVSNRLQAALWATANFN